MLISILLLVFGRPHALAMKNKYYGNVDEFDYPGPISVAEKSSTLNNQLVRSIELAKQISTIQNEDEFFKLLQIMPTESSDPLTYSFDIVERSNSLNAMPAKCMPEPKVVKVKKNPDPAAIYFPNCIRINRCGGCCNHELLSCQPTATEIRNYEIYVTKLVDESDQHSTLKEIIPLEEHTACICDCKVTKKECSDKHYYNNKECRCICKNFYEEDKCYQQNEKKIWNPENCLCQCRKVEECSTGFYFDQTLCSCTNVPLSMQWFNNEKHTGYIFRKSGIPTEAPPVIIALDVRDYRRKHKEDPEYK